MVSSTQHTVHSPQLLSGNGGGKDMLVYEAVYEASLAFIGHHDSILFKTESRSCYAAVLTIAERCNDVWSCCGCCSGPPV